MRAHVPPTPPSIVAQVAGLPDLSMVEIKGMWRQLFGSDNPTSNRQFLERRIAYRLQEIEFRKVNPLLMERNQNRIQSIIKTGKNTDDRSQCLMPGTVLTREYQGVEHQVLVTPDEHFEFQGRRYPSLSMIAREITGTRWSGPLFFGVKASTKPEKKKTKQGGRP